MLYLIQEAITSPLPKDNVSETSKIKVEVGLFKYLPYAMRRMENVMNS